MAFRTTSEKVRTREKKPDGELMYNKREEIRACVRSTTEAMCTYITAQYSA